MNRTEILNALIEKYKYKSYLEIGVGDGANVKNIVCTKITVVDPGDYGYDKIDFKCTSDEFFAVNKKVFDIVFIDGHHEENQVIRDVENSLKFLKKGGTIMCHDMKPEHESQQVDPNYANGNCWRGWVRLISTRDDLEMRTVDTDQGCGIIRRGTQIPVDLGDLEINWENFSTRKKEWLNLITVDEFKALYLNA